MKKKACQIIGMCLLLASSCSIAKNLPNDFVYLKNIAPSIIQDMRYAGHHNFVGRPIAGYHAATCVLTRRTAKQLAKVQQTLNQSGYSLKVYDCYRPQRAVNDFIAWSHNNDKRMKKEFYPRVAKKDFFKLGFVAAYSGHTRGSTVDLTIVALPAHKQATYKNNQTLTACFSPYIKRFKDNSINMGTGYDCMDDQAHARQKNIPKIAIKNRLLLRNLMKQYGFKPYNKEWWHFTLRREPHARTYFDFVIPKN